MTSESTTTAAPSVVRLGRVERTILEVLHRNGPVVPRDTVLRAVFPALTGDVQVAVALCDSTTGPLPTERRAHAEASVSRAIASLQRKGLVVRERHRSTGRTHLRAPGTERLPAWEQRARAEEDFAAQTVELAKRCRVLAAQARTNARQLRAERRGDLIHEEIGIWEVIPHHVWKAVLAAPLVQPPTPDTDPQPGDLRSHRTGPLAATNRLHPVYRQTL